VTCVAPPVRVVATAWLPDRPGLARAGVAVAGAFVAGAVAEVVRSPGEGLGATRGLTAVTCKWTRRGDGAAA
jgi:hypothetical protein